MEKNSFPSLLNRMLDFADIISKKQFLFNDIWKERERKDETVKEDSFGFVVRRGTFWNDSMRYDDTADQNAVNDATEGNNTDKNNVDKNNADRNNTDSNNTDNDGVLEDVGRGIDNGVRDVVDGVEDVVDGNETNRTDTANHAGSANNGKAGQ